MEIKDVFDESGFTSEHVKSTQSLDEEEIPMLEKEQLLGYIREFEERTGMNVEEYKQWRRNGGAKLISNSNLHFWEGLIFTLARLEAGEVLNWLEFGFTEPIPLTLERAKDDVQEFEDGFGMTLEEFKQAIADGEILNYSLALLQMWEGAVRRLKEMENDAE